MSLSSPYFRQTWQAAREVLADSPFMSQPDWTRIISGEAPLCAHIWCAHKARASLVSENVSSVMTGWAHSTKLANATSWPIPQWLC